MSELAAGAGVFIKHFDAIFIGDQKAFSLAILCRIGSYWLSCVRLACDWS